MNSSNLLTDFCTDFCRNSKSVKDFLNGTQGPFEKSCFFILC